MDTFFFAEYSYFYICVRLAIIKHFQIHFSLQVLDQRIPFLIGSIEDIQHHVPNTKDSMVSFIEIFLLHN